MQTTEHPESQVRLAQATGLSHYSLEIGAADLELLERYARQIPPGTDIFLNIMAGERLEDRVRTCARIKALGFVPIPHIAATRLGSEDELESSLWRLMNEGSARDLLVVSGDAKPAGPYSNSTELVDWIVANQVPVRRLGVTGYPEGHPGRSGPELSQLLASKLERIATSVVKPFVVLQFSFVAASVVRWCRDFHAQHPDVMVCCGLPGPAKLTTLVRFAQRCGVKSSMARVLSMPLSSGMKLVQRVPPVEQLRAIRDYRESENPNVAAHFFCFGGLHPTLEFIGQQKAWPKGLRTE